jgi:hypothetical protein
MDVCVCWLLLALATGLTRIIDPDVIKSPKPC